MTSIDDIVKINNNAVKLIREVDKLLVNAIVKKIDRMIMEDNIVKDTDNDR